MRNRRWGLFLGGACLALSCSLARSAGADPAPLSYVMTVDGSSVEVCIAPIDYGTCGSPMLREDADGAVVSVTGTVNLGNSGTCYIDECVPPGTYRYGCQVPIQCGSPPFWTSATVTEPLDGGCTWPDGSAPPTPVTGGPPWPGNAFPCASSGGCGCSAAGSVFGFDGSVLALSLAFLWRRRRNARRTHGLPAPARPATSAQRR
jgi:hypothetical protein